ncbi:hypothetical protein SDC9_196027 [bioreactor metagenome]|uniref:Uncharacterized protein n=1 Tax=bioreactor metagenome TaxID=1076179 RepID=A0A645IBB2_9ZZZZ
MNALRLLGVERGELLSHVLSRIETAEQSAEQDRDQHKHDQRGIAHAAFFAAVWRACAAVLRGLRRIPFIPIVVLIHKWSLLSGDVASKENSSFSDQRV